MCLQLELLFETILRLVTSNYFVEEGEKFATPGRLKRNNPWDWEDSKGDQVSQHTSSLTE